MPDETSRRYPLVAIDRATRWVSVRVMSNNTAADFSRFLTDPARVCPIKIPSTLTDNGKEFTDRLFASRNGDPTDSHEFNKLYDEFEIGRHLTMPRSPQTNRMVEQFNGRIAEVLKTNRFVSGEDLEQKIIPFVALYKTQFPQSDLGSRTPVQAIKD